MSICLWVCVCACISWRGQKASSPLELGLYRVVSCHLGAGNRTGILSNGSQWVLFATEHLPSPGSIRVFFSRFPTLSIFFFILVSYYRCLLFIYSLLLCCDFRGTRSSSQGSFHWLPQKMCCSGWGRPELQWNLTNCLLAFFFFGSFSIMCPWSYLSLHHVLSLLKTHICAICKNPALSLSACHIAHDMPTSR